MLMRFDPFREMDSVAQALARRGDGHPSMAMDAYREGDRFVIQMDLPGVDPSSIDMTVEKNVLTVAATRRWEPSDGQEVLIAERPQGAFTRRLFLGESLDADRIEATYRNGVLTITIPVAEQAKPRKVQVASSDAAPAAIGTNAA